MGHTPNLADIDNFRRPISFRGIVHQQFLGLQQAAVLAT